MTRAASRCNRRGDVTVDVEGDRDRRVAQHFADDLRVAHGPSIGVRTVGEAATRLGMSRAQLDAMIARGGVETLPIEFGCVVSTTEVERLQRTRTNGP